MSRRSRQPLRFRPATVSIHDDGDVLAKGELLPLDEERFSSYLMTAAYPPVDLLIRTSGELRISNFLLWQIAYAELIFTPVAWPDFDERALAECLEEYHRRDRRFGGISE